MRTDPVDGHDKEARVVALLWIVAVLLFVAAVLIAVFGGGWRMFHPHH